ncbi:beta-amyrin 11-oxidase-like isoform X2 [Tripterygium wilfordii]|uniref:beta-amyrin 11-oxidase-like isoform X2 n=1 Tax=Tripterygium wilfordii TaxID=458696 RepID=UPI0018F848D2|nr:beta-amyrin 11-oxidase-like isoform X2 [Tripterygium wilfordii]
MEEEYYLKYLRMGVIFILGGYVFVFWFLKRANELYYCYIQRLGFKQPRPLPPGDMGWPIIGNMFSFLKAFRDSDEPHSFINNLAQRYGKTGIYKTHLFGSPSAIVCLPETCKAVLTDDENYKLGYSSLFALIGKKLFDTLHSTEHKRLRRLTASPINGHDALSVYIGFIEDVMMDSLDEWSSMRNPIELRNVLKEATLKVITNISFGPQLGSSIYESLKNPFNDLVQGVFKLGINLPGFAFHKAVQARRKLGEILDAAIEDVRVRNKSNESKEEKKSMLDLLLEAENEDSEKLDNETIVDILIGVLFAGHDTTAGAIMWVMLFLHDHPQILQKVKEEQEAIIRNRPATQKGLTMEEIKQMSYTMKVIQEALRRANIVTSLFRETKVDVNINGYTVPKGWKVLVMIRSVHLDPEIHPNPKEFDPSRWDNKQMRRGAFLPFGLGSRYCAGSDLAKNAVCIFVHSFLLHYKLERIHPGCPMVYFPDPRPKDNCLAKITKL